MKMMKSHSDLSSKVSKVKIDKPGNMSEYTSQELMRTIRPNNQYWFRPSFHGIWEYLTSHQKRRRNGAPSEKKISRLTYHEGLKVTRWVVYENKTESVILSRF